MAQDTFSRSVWSAITPPARPAPALEGATRADVAVVGAGFLGLVTALHLAEAGVDVVLLEAEEPGFGASGRNTGFVVPSLKAHITPAHVKAALGPEHGERLFRLVGASGAAVFDLVDRLGLACDAERTGWLQPAHTPATLRVLEGNRDNWLTLGRSVDILSPDETTRMSGVAGYHGALFDRTGGQINPLAYARELARALGAAGGRLHAGTRVTALTAKDGGWLVETDGGSVQAGRVVLTTNALVGDLVPALDASIVPVRVHQIATQPLPAELQQRILPRRCPLADTRRHTLAIRWSPDGRLLTGGLVVPGPAPLARAASFFTARLRRYLPGLPALRAEHVWSGVIAATMDSLPRLYQLGPGLDAVVACNGRGIALTTAMGIEMAKLLTGRVREADFVLPRVATAPIAGRRLTGVAPAFWLPWNALRDRIEAGR
ncbi:FAD-binding oxidoreductase [uncultured Alsobacter sp.]|uniref:NAD(P)/FAD-dependent oxidoreductase n=1 Tax=uncultured Alsobacter sp. TaxID=1748258 RepID=UPI0025D10D17|nr:FAD-dependent oxidoreductase [uncultured Alsobacter sp.]